jgi:hypothetical protein
MIQKTGCEELMQVFDHFPKCHMKILLDFNAKLVREFAFLLTMGMRVYIRIVMIMVLECQTLPHQESSC